MGLDIDVYKRNTYIENEEVGDYVFDFCKDCWSLLSYLKTLDDSNFSKEQSFAVFRLSIEQVIMLKSWIKDNVFSDCRYISFFNSIQDYDGELIIKADW